MRGLGLQRGVAENSEPFGTPPGLSPKVVCVSRGVQSLRTQESRPAVPSFLRIHKLDSQLSTARLLGSQQQSLMLPPGGRHRPYLQEAKLIKYFYLQRNKTKPTCHVGPGPHPAAVTAAVEGNDGVQLQLSTETSWCAPPTP